MSTFLITGNMGKLRELQAILPKSLNLEYRDIDLMEIQSLDPREVVSHKLREAYEAIGFPVVVEDVSAEIDSLNGLPGTFVKFFMQKLGGGALYKLAGEGQAVTIRCTMGYFDGSKEVLTEGVIRGTITKPRGEGGFGFDPTVIPDGYDVTIGEMTPEQKNAISHRYLAAKELADALSSIV